MKDEIKEILNKLRSDNYYKKEYQKSIYYERDLKKLEDCITNLQEEVKSSNESITWWQNRFNALQEENKKLKHKSEQMYNDTKDTYNEICAEQIDYKSRNEKATKYINEEQQKIDEMGDNYCYLDEYEINNLLNILQGDDESENKSNK